MKLVGPDPIFVTEIASPASPASGSVAIYAKNDGSIYIQNDAGEETDLSKRRTQLVSNVASITPDVDAYDAIDVIDQSQALTINDPVGTPKNISRILIRITDNGTSRSLTFGSAYVSVGTDLPTETVPNTPVVIGFLYDATRDEWQLVGLTGQTGGGGSDDQTASEVPFTPAGSIAATNVQAAIEELDDDIQGLGGSPNNILLPTTTDTVGQIKWNSNVGIHTYGPDNFFACGNIGSPAGNFTLTGASNVGIGSMALSSLTSGAFNIAIGASALQSAESTGNSIALGTDALSQYTGSGGCIAIGTNALAAATTGVGNIAIGAEALYEATVGVNNVGIGTYALNHSTDAINNTAVGTICFRDNTTGENNTGIGYGAGVENETGSNNTCLGYLAGPATADLNNITAIGANASVTTDNTLVLGDSSVGVVIGTTAAEDCALLTLVSTSRGLLLPRMTTTQRNAIADPINGLVIHNVTTETLDTYQNNEWASLATSSISLHDLTNVTVVSPQPGDNLSFDGEAWINVSPDGDKGDITVSELGTDFTINIAAVTYGKIQNVSSGDVLLGRATGSGVIQEITCTQSGRDVISQSNALNQRQVLGLEIGVDVQAYSDVLANLVDVFVPASGTLPAYLMFHERTDNGVNRIHLFAQPILAENVEVLLPAASGTIALLSDTVAAAEYANQLFTPRSIYGNNFDGTAALTQVIASTYGGTGNGYVKFTGVDTSEKTFTLPNASCEILTTNDPIALNQLVEINGYRILGCESGPGPVVEMPCTSLGFALLSYEDVSNLRTTGLGLGSIALENTGASGTFLSSDDPPKTITVVNGIITAINE